MAKQDYINAIAHCSALNILPETARGNFVLFLINWISAGCRPVDMSQLQIPIGMKDAVWNRYKIAINNVAEVIMPELRAIYKNRVNSRAGVREWRKKEKQRKALGHTFTDSDITIQEQDKRPRKLSQTPQYPASHAQNVQKSNINGDIPSGMLRDR